MVNEIIRDEISNDTIKLMLSKLAQGQQSLVQSQQNTNEVLFGLINGFSPIIMQTIEEKMIQVSNRMSEEMIVTKQAIKNEVLSSVDNKVKTAINERGLNRLESRQLTNARNAKFRTLLGDCKSDKYTLYIHFYSKKLSALYCEQFQCCAYADVQADRFEEALSFINNFYVTDKYIDWCTEKLHENYANGELTGKKLNAYIRYFGAFSANER